MSKQIVHNGNGGRTSSVDTEDSDLLNRPQPANTERNGSFADRSSSQLSITLSPRKSHPSDFLESLGSPRSSSCFNTHPIFGEAWNALRRSLVYFRGQAVGTVAAMDHSSEQLNYNQVKFLFFTVFFCLHTHKIVIACYSSSERFHHY